jgi:hypothetical protein
MTDERKPTKEELRDRKRLPIEAAALLIVVMPPVRGIRHYVQPGGEHTLCGRACSLWLIDTKGGPASCHVCVDRRFMPAKHV